MSDTTLTDITDERASMNNGFQQKKRVDLGWDRIGMKMGWDGWDGYSCPQSCSVNILGFTEIQVMHGSCPDDLQSNEKGSTFIKRLTSSTEKSLVAPTLVID